ncbi:hypothetical protein [Azospirillum sp.]|uniref:calcium-binding protein n=1 Tax=Azospirillum sp. TaxID=34012 RepID=UPI002D2FCD3C|nr:hypothetical protein [Azospirillum sp.]HYD66542.1 hypothetical protein [Azospirillum sp.]
MATVPSGVTTLSSGTSGPLDAGTGRAVQGEKAHIVGAGGAATDDDDGAGDHSLLVFGGTGDDPVAGDTGNDPVAGGAGDDLVIGGTGNDLLIGGAGNDVIHDGSGNDVMVGGKDRDVFVIATGDGHDVITDFATGDVLEIAHDVDGLSVAAPNDLVALINTDPSGNAVIFLGAEHSITLLGVSADDLIRHIDDYIRII